MSNFRLRGGSSARPENPEALFRDLRGRDQSIQYLWAHQADLLRSYHEQHLQTSDLALELPTGTGKTLVGLLIAEFRRRSLGERTIYLCPTRQLAHQVGGQAARYGIPASVLVGKQAEYDPASYASYATGNAVAVTTYSAVFNVHPRLDDGQLIILDDAHAAEGYIASLWSVDIDRTEFPDLFRQTFDLFADLLPEPLVYDVRLENPDPIQRRGIDAVPIPVAHKRQAALRELIDSRSASTHLQYPWSTIRAHLDACLIYVSWNSILIRPYIPPSLTHEAFARARQRLCMSATLGEGGELERIIGVPRIERLPVPSGWDRQGTGRRFIVFPNHSLDEDEATRFAGLAVERMNRILVLCPNTLTARQFQRDLINCGVSKSIMGAGDVEETLDPFTKAASAILILTNRYDGLDLPGDSCRMLLLVGEPSATNAQERFLLQRLGASSLLRDRIRTRITQAVGRCTRSATDYAGVVMLGPELFEFCARHENRAGMHPELQAEMQFGLDNSAASRAEELLGRLDVFFAQRAEWTEAEREIVALRGEIKRKIDSLADKLRGVVSSEVNFVYDQWRGDHHAALGRAREVCDGLSGGRELRPYQAWWYYLAGGAAWLAADSDEALRVTARELFGRASATTTAVSWFAQLGRERGGGVAGPAEAGRDPLLVFAAENIQRELSRLGSIGPRFESHLKQVEGQLRSTEATPYELGLLALGKLLGFDAKRPDGGGAPDNVWSLQRRIFLSLEAKNQEGGEGGVSLSTTRQAKGHIEWLRERENPPDEAQLYSIVITPRIFLDNDAAVSARGLCYLHTDRVLEMAGKVFAVLRRVRAESVQEPVDLLRERLCDALIREGLDPVAVVVRLTGKPLLDVPRVARPA